MDYETEMTILRSGTYDRKEELNRIRQMMSADVINHVQYEELVAEACRGGVDNV